MTQGRRRTKEEIAKDRAEVARLYLQGIYQAEIAEKLGFTQQQISYDLAQIRKDWQSASIRDFDEARAQELAKIDNLELTYWEAWERSLEEFKSEISKARINREGKNEAVAGRQSTEKTVKTEERNGDPRYLQGVQWCIERRCKLLGLDDIPGSDDKPFVVKVVKGVSSADL